MATFNTISLWFDKISTIFQLPDFLSQVRERVSTTTTKNEFKLDFKTRRGESDVKLRRKRFGRDS